MENEKKLASTQINLTGQLARVVLDIASAINDADLHAKGRENEPHITVLYGFTSDDCSEIESICRKTWPVRFTVGQPSLFDCEEYDVLKLDVTGKDLHELNEVLSKLPHENSHPEYCPHVTIAYLKKGKGCCYTIHNFQLPIDSYADKIQFSSSERLKKEIPLGPKL